MSARGLCSALAMLLVAGCSPNDEGFSPAALARADAAARAVRGNLLREHVFSIVARRVMEDAPVSKYNERETLTRLNAAKYLTDTYAALGLVPVIESAPLTVGTSTTIYVDIPGERPELVLLSGHYDAWFHAGADDNASALAVLLEAARVLKDTKPKRTIRIIAFDHEEEGILGSVRYYADHRADSVRVMINMDCVGFASDRPGSQVAPPGLALRDTGDFLAAIANEPAGADLSRFVKLSGATPDRIETLGLLAPGNAHYPGAGAFLRSDHVAYWDAGISAIFLTDTANFRNKNYHTADDLPETLDYAFLARVGALTVGAAAAFAEND